MVSEQKKLQEIYRLGPDGEECYGRGRGDGGPAQN